MDIFLCITLGAFLVSGALVIRTAYKRSKIDILETSVFGLSGLILSVGLVILVIKG
ncbi:hypothetical protein P4493_04985 [Bacillus thuringiensis]|uniref:Membrane protein n=1 Tax=Bacillus thuringiensis TaxID=1428 RepID=A0AB33AQ32_BACTU|nr:MULTISPECIES: hypothetical protein [Bacillus]MEC2535620.1 hypothetical protein [Bacillus cereus]MED1153651.1 hypothetical protein [Bacillus paranthracis]AJG73924.1 putative membrane protein [Bacillus thuringiensis]AJH02911.1 putative membrane protein [Bacillus thuringiensis HD1002]MCC4011950.1 hypothetical protein [Bacillus thuringiensis]